MTAFEKWRDEQPNQRYGTEYRKCWEAALEHAAEICEEATSDANKYDIADEIRKEIEK